MNKRFWALSVLAVFLLAAGTVRAQSVDEKIKALEQELTQLKDQQIELKKEATAAVAAIPSFSYRPGNGLNIEAADKSWGVRFTLESHFRYNFESGRDQVGRSQGELMGRRFRPGVFYCINNCLWEIEATLESKSLAPDCAVRHGSTKCSRRQLGETGFRIGRRAGRV
jgi:hypothetical protein